MTINFKAETEAGNYIPHIIRGKIELDRTEITLSTLFYFADRFCKNTEQYNLQIEDVIIESITN